MFGFVIFAYFSFHLVQGDRGYFALQGVKERQVVAERHLAKAQSERIVLEHRVRLLRSSSLDPDMLDERVRAVLNYADQDELIIIEQTDTNH